MIVSNSPAKTIHPCQAPLRCWMGGRRAGVVCIGAVPGGGADPVVGVSAMTMSFRVRLVQPSVGGDPSVGVVLDG